MEATKIVITGKPLVDLDNIPDMLGDVENDIDRNFAPPPDTIQQVVAEMRVMIDKYSLAEAAQIATSSPY